MRFIILALAMMTLPLAAPLYAGPKGCPPGLAKKAVPCVPPGHAKAWRKGDRLPRDLDWYEIRDWGRYGLPAPPPGSQYVLIDNEVLRVAIATGIILDYLGVF